ncbi:MAG: DUF262 domain-containing HNH endonuclease family protein [Chloroflexi bacterium]|nr:DUF262 domain-containing HNH endonuclease family protein [Chloroflexota bacterium]MBU1748729.1 DUF262 domain-containing HNH endonuclease family protein [Chloroflexota bacterium]
MKEIQGKARTVRELLKGLKYSIDYYQREFKWGKKQVAELINDLSTRFLEDYQEGHARTQVAHYGHYFLGAIIISHKDGKSYIVDGQQRLTTLTLLLIYLNNLGKQSATTITNVDELIYSERFGEKSFNLQVDERTACMGALFDQQPFDPNGQPESVQNILARYDDIAESLPEEVRGAALAHFVDWVLENVHLVEITAYSDEDAYVIFETMNDRGLSLSPTDMLKGYLLANITDLARRNVANDLWRRRILEMNEVGKDVAADSFKAWLRSQYASKIRERKRGAKPEDFDRIGTEFHRWVRDNRKSVGLADSSDFAGLIERDFEFYSRQYMRLMHASESLEPGLEHVLYNAHHGFTLQHMLLLAPLNPDDSLDVVNLKLRLVGMFVDILLTWRLWNFRSIAYSTMQYAMFQVMRDIRGLDPESLALKLHETLDREEYIFGSNDRLYMHQQNRWYLHRILARMIGYMEQQSDLAPRYMEYVTSSGRERYEVEHIWADKPERHADEFDHPNDFREYRNRIGGLLLLPRSFNNSYGALPYEAKLPHYNSQNLLARSLYPQCYEHNPGFLRFVQESGLPFQPHGEFKKADLDARQDLLRRLAEQIWNPDDLLKEVEG